jgi:multisubunit Na+/H+ antiporter MnhG subunit
MVDVNMDTVKNIFFYGFIIVILYILITGKLTRDNVIIILMLLIGAVILDLIYRAFKKEDKKQDKSSSDFPSDKCRG